MDRTIATPDHLFYMRCRASSRSPRTSGRRAAQELGFVPRAAAAQFAWLEAHRYPFRIPNAAFALAGGPTVFEAVPGHVQAVALGRPRARVTVTLRVPLDGAVIRYTTDGTAPSRVVARVSRPFTVPAGAAPVVLRAAAFFHGRAGAISECAVVRSSPAALRAYRGASASWSALVSP